MVNSKTILSPINRIGHHSIHDHYRHGMYHFHIITVDISRYDESKFGVFCHWGVYSVAGHGEWLWYNWKVEEDPITVDYITNNYKPNFAYADFGPLFTADFFNATEFADIVQSSGARLVFLVEIIYIVYYLDILCSQVNIMKDIQCGRVDIRGIGIHKTSVHTWILSVGIVIVICIYRLFQVH